MNDGADGLTVFDDVPNDKVAWGAAMYTLSWAVYRAVTRGDWERADANVAKIRALCEAWEGVPS